VRFNSHETSEFNPTRGLQQGDPLPLSLFDMLRGNIEFVIACGGGMYILDRVLRFAVMLLRYNIFYLRTTL
jgi:hypothetical protein